MRLSKVACISTGVRLLSGARQLIGDYTAEGEEPHPNPAHLAAHSSSVSGSVTQGFFIFQCTRSCSFI
jgi:hypothetical protein